MGVLELIAGLLDGSKGGGHRLLADHRIVSAD